MASRLAIDGDYPPTIEQEGTREGGAFRYLVREDYTASDGEVCPLRIIVVLSARDEGRALHRAAEHFRERGRAEVEVAKASGNWPLPDPLAERGYVAA